MDNIEQFTVIPLRDVVVFPHMIVPIFVGRPRSVKALQIASSTDKMLFLTLQKDASTDSPHIEDLNEIGVVAKILQNLELPDGTVKVLVEGKSRAKIKNFRLDDECYFADVEIVEDELPPESEYAAAREALIKNFESYAGQTKRINPELTHNIIQSDDLSKLSFMIASNLKIKAAEFQEILDISRVTARAEKIIELIQTELELIKIDDRIKNRVKAKMNQSQKEYYLNEKIKAIQKEMGKEDEYKADIEEIEQKVKELKLPDAVREKAEREIKKMRLMPPMSAETTVVRNYLDWIVSLPWNIRTDDALDIKHAEDILNRDHYGLEKPKERILEFLAVRKLSENMKGSIIC
ncbi:MAG: LON peptidase substrate-binding domain-containing protein, partial [Mucispirillum sp.]|nr:LON peptidase substrate-binding domain-containing protein [Mucispirillum sp.]